MARLALFLLLLAPTAAFAHAGSKSWLTLQVQGTELQGRLAASQVDVALALGLDFRQSPAALRPQIAARQDEVRAYIARGLVLLLNGERYPMELGRPVEGFERDQDVLSFSLHAGAPQRIDAVDIGYTLFFEDDVLHECLARLEWDGQAVERVLRLGEPLQHIDRASGSASGFVQFLRSGVWHIWTGYDHVLFLLALLLPAVLVSRARSWVAAPALRPALVRAATIVTAFTIAHSLTLVSAALGWISLPERPIEAAIAISVFIAAAANFLPATAAISGPGMAFAFGLLHGFGFAGALSGLIPDSAQVWRPLLGFNLGVELGQLAIIAIFFPVAWWLRGTRFYRVAVLRGGSAVVCAFAAAWFIARVT